jgi:hypothetical protein
MYCYYNVLYLMLLRWKEVYKDRIDVYSHLDVAEVLIEKEICNAVMNPQTI